MAIPTSEERREVAERLRENASKHGVTLDYLGSTQVASWWLLLHTIGCNSNEQEAAFRMLADFIDPTCEMVPNKVPYGDFTNCRCSACGYDNVFEPQIRQVDAYPVPTKLMWNYCPHCGARIVRIVP